MLRVALRAVFWLLLGSVAFAENREHSYYRQRPFACTYPRAGHAFGGEHRWTWKSTAHRSFPRITHASAFSPT